MRIKGKCDFFECWNISPAVRAEIELSPEELAKQLSDDEIHQLQVWKSFPKPQEKGHKCPWNKATTCNLHYECNGCETHAIWVANWMADFSPKPNQYKDCKPLMKCGEQKPQEVCDCVIPFQEKKSVFVCGKCGGKLTPKPEPQRIEPLTYDQLDIMRIDPEKRQFASAIQLAINQLRQKTDELVHAINQIQATL
jgi:hypothetical protein